ncbi:hypothetical protein AVEN_107423-1 [Araneus ventricosus]|uniref:Uncharacterized protein n=1 Tax=Araneus ventricosus TaxID=182803 RepID=A0A4Y2JD16_ARAVE|nr:hypothetical protein AVEN_107423-1 [Araneus ventricosus]
MSSATGCPRLIGSIYYNAPSNVWATKCCRLGQRMYSVKKGHFHRRNVNQRPQRYLVPGEEYARQEKQLPDVSLTAIQASILEDRPRS